MIDVAAIAKLIVDIITPALPFLGKVGENIASDAAKKIGSSAWTQALSVWSKLKSEISTNFSLEQSIQDLADNPSDSDAQAALRLQIKKVLSADNQLLQEFNSSFQHQSTGNTVTASEGSIAAGGNISDNVIILGDRNRLK